MLELFCNYFQHVWSYPNYNYQAPLNVDELDEELLMLKFFNVLHNPVNTFDISTKLNTIKIHGIIDC